MNVLLVTLIDNYNLGNRLQHLALQTELEKLGNQVSNVIYEKDTISYNRNKQLVKKILYRIGIKKYWNKVVAAEGKSKKFEAFTNKYIKNHIVTDLNNAFIQDWSKFDYAIVGSDQVWHNWHEQFNTAPDKDLPYFYLEFMPQEKRIAYAPSFGFTEFPAEDREEHIKGLDGMAVLSCREKDGCDLIKKETGRDAEWVLDPTLLLEKGDWDKIANKPSYVVPDHFLLLYFLGNITEEYQAKIDEVAEKYQLKVINILTPETYPDYYQTAPDEFIYLISHASFICTDSFHATVFSIIFGKNFISFRRQQEGFMNMFGRIGDLLESTGLKDHEYDKDRIPQNNVDGAFEKLKDRQETSVEYLKKLFVNTEEQ